MVEYEAKCPGCGLSLRIHVDEPISIEQAAAHGIERLRMPRWTMPTDYLKIDIIDGKPGPWVHLYSETNEEINGRNPVDVLGAVQLDYREPAYVPYIERV